MAQFPQWYVPLVYEDIPPDSHCSYDGPLMDTAPRTYATFYAEDTFEYLLRYYEIAWKPNRTILLQELHFNTSMRLKFDKDCAKATYIAFTKYRWEVAAESRLVWSAVKWCPPDRMKNMMYHSVLHLARKLNYDDHVKFFIFMVTVVDLIALCFRDDQNHFLQSIILATQLKITQFYPGEVNQVFIKLKAYAKAFLAANPDSNNGPVLCLK